MAIKNLNIYLLILVIIVIIYCILYNNDNYFNNIENKLEEKKSEKKVIINNIKFEDKNYIKDYMKNPYLHNSDTEKNKIINTYPSIYGPPTLYPNAVMPSLIIGCGGRRGACMGDSQIPMANTLPPIDISNDNIAPVNLTVRGFDSGLDQVGTIQKVFGTENYVYPLFGRRKYRNDSKWEYYVKFGKYGVLLPVYGNRNYDELSTNDEVLIQGQKDKYRVIIYDSDIPIYLPYS